MGFVQSGKAQLARIIGVSERGEERWEINAEMLSLHWKSSFPFGGIETDALGDCLGPLQF
jgi:hypothetical protein